MFKKTLFTFFLTVSMFSQTDKIEIESLLSQNISIRSIVMDHDNLYFAGTNNQFGCVNLKSKKVIVKKIINDSLKIEFRSIAQTKSDVFILSTGNPALLYKIDKKTFSPQLVYEERNEKVFYDSMQFLDNTFGMAMGDPIEKGFCVITTTNGGATWTKTPDHNLPELFDGEAAFAASNSSLVLTKNKIYMASGGKKARVFSSSDLGKTWNTNTTPIVQGNTMTGIFSMAFYDDNIGFIAGGDYEKPNQNFRNKAITTNGGITWQLVAENEGFGYASCVAFVPNLQGKQLYCVGASGVYYSENSGATWKQIAADKDLYVLKVIDSKTIFAAGKNKILKISYN